jgi:hypothetical protein
VNAICELARHEIFTLIREVQPQPPALKGEVERVSRKSVLLVDAARANLRRLPRGRERNEALAALRANRERLLRLAENLHSSVKENAPAAVLARLYHAEGGCSKLRAAGS